MAVEDDGALGAVAYKDRGKFDDKFMLSDEYRYNGMKGGTAWKTRLERYIVARSPALRELLEWAESLDNVPISEAMVIEAASGRLTKEQTLSVKSKIWGFLSGCLTGTADVLFRRAAWLDGVDAWPYDLARDVEARSARDTSQAYQISGAR